MRPRRASRLIPPAKYFPWMASSGSNDAEYLETQAQVLQSDGVAIDVIRKLRLDQNPNLVGESKPGEKPTAAAPDATASGLQLTAQEKAALGKFSAALKVRRDTSSRLVLVSFSSHDPQLAALVANTIVQTFIEDTFQNRHNAIMKSSEWLSRQLDDIRTKMETSSQALAEFQGSIGVADVDGDKSTYTEHMGELSRQFTQAESERIQLEALLKNIQGNPDSLPEVRNSPVVQQLSQKLAEQRAELSQSLVVYGSQSPGGEEAAEPGGRVAEPVEQPETCHRELHPGQLCRGRGARAVDGGRDEGHHQRIGPDVSLHRAQEGSPDRRRSVQLAVCQDQRSGHRRGLEIGQYSPGGSGPGSGHAEPAHAGC